MTHWDSPVFTCTCLETQSLLLLFGILDCLHIIEGYPLAMHGTPNLHQPEWPKFSDSSSSKPQGLNFKTQTTWMMSDDDYMLWSTSNHECTVTLSRWRSTIIDHHGAMKPTLVYFPQGWAQPKLNRDPPFTSLQIIWGSCRVGDLQQALGTFGLVLQDLRCLGCNLGRVAESMPMHSWA